MTQNYMFLSSLYQSKRLSKGSERSVYWNESKTKIQTKNMTQPYRYFLQLIFLGVNRFFVLVNLNEDGIAERFKTQRYYLSKNVIKNHNVITYGKNFYN